MSRPSGVAILVLLSLGLGAAWFFTYFERVPDRVFVGMQGEARLKPFLAAQRFARRMGLHSNEVRSLPELDALAPGAILLLPMYRQTLDAARIRRLISWVERGGHLIVEAETRVLPDPVLDRLGVQRVADSRWVRNLQVATPRSGRPLDITPMPGPALQTRAQTLLLRGVADAGKRGEALKLASFPQGKGLVTVAASLDFARNNHVGDRDNALFLWDVLQLTGAKQFQVFFRPERLSLMNFLYDHAAEALGAAALLLALWLWRIAPRFGPIATDPAPGRRRLLDHLRASGRYYWGRGERQRLVAAARDAALRRIARLQPDFPAAPPAEQAARVAALAGLAPDEAAQWLSAAGAERAADFVRLLQHAQRVHAAIDRGGLNKIQWGEKKT